MLQFRTPEVFLHVLLISIYFQAFRVHSRFQFVSHHTYSYNASISSHTWHKRKSMSHEFLHAHNSVRAKYGLSPLIWDRSLAHFARRHASKLVANCAMVHSIGKYGENLFWGKLDHWTPTRIVEDWAKESQYFNMKDGKCIKDWTECGHFTQIVWADTVRVGCHRLKCNGINRGFIGICNYDPPGNVAQQHPFTQKHASSSSNRNVKPSSSKQHP